MFSSLGVANSYPVSENARAVAAQRSVEHVCADGMVGGCLFAEGPNERTGASGAVDGRMFGPSRTSSQPSGEARQAGREATESLGAASDPESPASTHRLMEEVCERENLKAALQRVKNNKGSPGIDGVTIDGLADYLRQHQPVIRDAATAAVGSQSGFPRIDSR